MKNGLYVLKEAVPNPCVCADGLEGTHWIFKKEFEPGIYRISQYIDEDNRRLPPHQCITRSEREDGPFIIRSKYGEGWQPKWAALPKAFEVLIKHLEPHTNPTLKQVLQDNNGNSYANQILAALLDQGVVTLSQIEETRNEIIAMSEESHEAFQERHGLFNNSI